MAEFHLLIDARWLRTQRTGVGTSILRHLQGLDSLLRSGLPRVRITVLRLATEANDPAWRLFSTLRIVDVFADPENHPGSDLWQQRELPRLAKRLGADVIFSPAFSGPWSGAVPRLLMIHDDLAWSRPESYPLRFRMFLRTATRLAALRSQRIIFPSEDARLRVARRLRISPSRTAAVLHGTISPESISPLAARERRIVYIASGERRKNHDLLVRAFPNTPMDFVGLAGNTSRIAELHRISQGQWNALPGGDEAASRALSTAAVSVHPAFAEGFGMPVLDALAAGTPVVAADIPVLREIAGDAAVYASPTDLEGWRRAVAETLTGGASVEERVTRGRARANELSLERTARQLIQEAMRCRRSPRTPIS